MVVEVSGEIDKFELTPTQKDGTTNQFFGYVSCLLVFFTLTAYFPLGYTPYFSGHQAVDFLICGFGIPAIALRILDKRYRYQAVIGVAFLFVSMISALYSGEAYVAFFGHYGLGEGWVFELSLICAWAIGISVSESKIFQKRLLYVIVVAAVVNVIVQVEEVLGNVYGFHIPGIYVSSDGGAGGLLVNPVYVAPLLISALAIVMIKRTWPLCIRLALVIVLISGVIASGDRLAILLLVPVSLIAIWKFALKEVAVLCVLWASVVSGYFADKSLSTGIVSAQISKAAVSLSTSVRFQIWSLGFQAFHTKPLFGYGPAGVFMATSPLSKATSVPGSPDVFSFISNVHNIVLNYLVETGVVGSILILLFLFLTIMRGRGIFLLVALTILTFNLIEPDMIGITPLMYFALGAASRKISSDARIEKPKFAFKLVSTISITVSFLFAFSILTTDYMVQLSQENLLKFSLRGTTVELNGKYVEVLNIVAPYSQISAQYYAQYYALKASVGEPSLYTDAIREAKIAVSRDPSNPYLWSQLGNYESADGDLVLAEKYFRVALTKSVDWPPSVSGLCSIETTLKKPDAAMFCKLAKAQQQ